jgi:hypothetical protein
VNPPQLACTCYYPPGCVVTNSYCSFRRTCCIVPRHPGVPAAASAPGHSVSGAHRCHRGGGGRGSRVCIGAEHRIPHHDRPRAGALLGRDKHSLWVRAECIVPSSGARVHGLCCVPRRLPSQLPPRRPPLRPALPCCSFSCAYHVPWFSSCCCSPPPTTLAATHHDWPPRAIPPCSTCLRLHCFHSTPPWTGPHSREWPSSSC